MCTYLYLNLHTHTLAHFLSFSLCLQGRKPLYVPARCARYQLLYPGDQPNDWICDCAPGERWHNYNNNSIMSLFNHYYYCWYFAYSQRRCIIRKLTPVIQLIDKAPARRVKCWYSTRRRSYPSVWAIRASRMAISWYATSALSLATIAIVAAIPVPSRNTHMCWVSIQRPSWWTVCSCQCNWRHAFPFRRLLRQTITLSSPRNVCVAVASPPKDAAQLQHKQIHTRLCQFM